MLLYPSDSTRFAQRMTYMVIREHFALFASLSANEIKKKNADCSMLFAESLQKFLLAVKGRGGGGAQSCGFFFFGGGRSTLSGETTYFGSFPFTTVQCKQMRDTVKV